MMIVLDSIRFIAAYAVVIIHFFPRISILEDSEYVKNLAKYHVFVDVFFMISGYVIFKIYSNRVFDLRSFALYMGKRFSRLVPLHWLTLIFFIGVGIVATIANLRVDEPYRYSTHCLVPNLLLIHATGYCDGLSFNFPSWSISGEIIAYILFPVMMLFMQRGVIAQAIFLSLILMVIYTLQNRYATREWFFWTYDYGFTRTLLFFFIGGVIQNYDLCLQKIKYPNVLFYISLTTLIISPLLNILTHWGVILISTLVVVFGAASSVQNKYDVVTYKLASLGRLTYSIYMIHPVIWTVWIKVVAEKVLKLGSGIYLDIMIITAFPIILAFSYISYVWFETPARKILNDRMGRKETPTNPSDPPVLTGEKI